MVEGANDKMDFVVYILYSSSLGKYYVGSTGDFAKRITEHNSGKGNFTSKGMPWVEIKIINCASRSEAVVLENKIKNRGIKRYLQDNNFL